MSSTIDQGRETYVLIPSSKKKYIKWLFVILILGLLGYGTYVFYDKYKYTFAKKHKKYEQTPSISESESDTKKQSYNAVLTNYCASWCSASINFAPVWDRFTQELEKSRPDIKTETMVCDKNDNEVQCNNAGIQAYPTVILYQDGKSIPFEGSRTILNLHEFIRLNTQPVKY
jgi:thiol-disulfide isomerase/thioredoxin